MTAYMKPQDRGVYQEQEAQILGDQTDGRGRRAVLQADPRLKALERGQHKEAIDRKLMYGRLGMEKKGQEHSMKMAEGSLAIAMKGQDLARKAFKFNLKQSSKAENIAKFGMALNLAMGMGGFIQSMRNRRKQDYLYNLTVQAHQAQIAENARLKEEADAQ
ncbi:MAG: hypothetical protein ACXABY_21675 [Candidatus Thorarchaeota archaeon]|jgi:hypothetical protein